MPWIDEVPEPLDAADGEQGSALWRVRTPTAGELLARKVPVAGPDQAGELVSQLRKLQQLTLYNVETVVGASEQGDTVWVLLVPVPSSSLGRLLASKEITVQQRAILALDLLAGLAELHGAGLSHPRVGERTAIVDVEGRLRLAEPWRLPGEASQPAEEVGRAGRLACWILGVGPRPGGALAPAEQQAPAMVAVARALAAGSESKAGDAFQALREAAGRLAQRESLEPSRGQISQRVRQLAGAPQVEAAPPPPPPRVSVSVGDIYAPEPATAGARGEPAGPSPAAASDDAGLRPPPPPRPRQPSPIQQLQQYWQGRKYRQPAGAGWQGSRPKGPVVAVGVAAGAVVLLLLLFVAVPALVNLARGTPQASSAATPQQRATPTRPAPKQSATSSPQQHLAGAVTGFQLTPQGACAPGGACTIRVQVNLQGLPQQTEVTWTLKVTDMCHGNATTDNPQPPVTAQAGWTYVYGIDRVTLPNSGKVQVVARTTSPADAASDPLTVGNGC
jgi:hypothetical protein